MPHKARDDVSLLFDMFAASKLVVLFVEDKSWSDYQQSPLLRSAVERQIGIIGECAWRVSKELKEEHEEMPWQKIAPARHRLIHEYDTIDDAIVWSIATKYIPELLTQLKEILPPLPED